MSGKTNKTKMSTGKFASALTLCLSLSCKLSSALAREREGGSLEGAQEGTQDDLMVALGNEKSCVGVPRRPPRKKIGELWRIVVVLGLHHLCVTNLL
jgi:hypothetical protein